MKIPRKAVDKTGFGALVKKCKITPTRENLNLLEDLLQVGRTSPTTRHQVRERVSELESEVAKDKRSQKRVAEELADPESRTPMKSKKYARKLGAKARQKSNA